MHNFFIMQVFLELSEVSICNFYKSQKTSLVFLKIINDLLKKNRDCHCTFYYVFALSGVLHEFLRILNLCFHLVLLNFPSLKSRLRPGMLKADASWRLAEAPAPAMTGRDAQQPSCSHEHACHTSDLQQRIMACLFRRRENPEVTESLRRLSG